MPQTLCLVRPRHCAWYQSYVSEQNIMSAHMAPDQVKLDLLGSCLSLCDTECEKQSRISDLTHGTLGQSH